ncbi:MAG: lipopolysaccharide kinase InaA family protein [Planctomycetota bacterium]
MNTISSSPGSALISRLTFDQLWNKESIEKITAYRTSDVSLIRLPDAARRDGVKCYRKRYWYPDLRRRLKGFFRNTFFGSSRARAEYKNLHKLHTLGLTRVGPLAFGEDRSLRLLSRAFILTEHLERTLTLNQWLDSAEFSSLARKKRILFLTSLARWVSSMHLRGYRDRDLFARNVLVHLEDSGWCFSKIDSPKGSGGRAEPHRGSRGPSCLKDLKDLDQDLCAYLNRTDRLRSIQAYVGAGRVDREVKALIKRLA